MLIVCAFAAEGTARVICCITNQTSFITVKTNQMPSSPLMSIQAYSALPHLLTTQKHFLQGKNRDTLRLTLHRGLFFQGNKLTVAFQNGETSLAGEIAQFDKNTGQFIRSLVSGTPAPYAPRGIIYLPEQGDQSSKLVVSDRGDLTDAGTPPGAMRIYDYQTGTHLTDLFAPEDEIPYFMPRGVVLGPDGKLYVTSENELNGLLGYISRFDPITGFEKLIASFDGTVRSDCTMHLHRPEGIVFGPDGNIYVTAFRSGIGDIDRILVFDPETGACLDDKTINLWELGQTRIFTQVLIFGPGGYLYGAMNNGDIRKYDVNTKMFEVYEAAETGAPWYLVFEKTNPTTLKYRN
jgi:WD40 repeat protein